MKKKTLAAIGVLVLGTFLTWLGGYDFDTRNFFVAWWAFIVIFFTALAYTCPAWEDE